MATLLVALVIGLIAVNWRSRGLQVKTDAETLCPSDRKPTDLLVVLLDMSDELTQPQHLQVDNELQRLRASIPKFGRLELYAVGRSKDRIVRPVFQLCNPGDGSDMSEIYQNPVRARQRWEEGFNKKLNAELNQQLAATSSDSSPIFEAIQATALRTFNSPKYDGVPKRLFVVSDLIQYMPGKLNQYAEPPNFAAFQKSTYFSDVRTDLRGVRVDILYLARPRIRVQGMGHVEFWGQYFAEQGASMESVTKVFGEQ